MPSTAPSAKLAAVQDTYKATVTIVEPTGAARRAGAAKVLAAVPGAVFIHPSENPHVIAGQGTVAVELAKQTEEALGDGRCLDVVIIPVGGGGLAGGCAVALRGIWGDRVKIVLAEPEAADDAKRSFEGGVLVGHGEGKKVASVADGLLTTLGPNTFPIIRDLADDVLTVTEREILASTKAVWERMKVMIEPSAGVGVAVLCSSEFLAKYPPSEFPNVGVVLCGGNVDVAKVSRMLEDEGI